MKRLRTFLKGVLIFIACLIFIIIIMQVLPPSKKSAHNSFMKDDKPFLCVDTSNNSFGPGNTILAFDEALKLDTQVLYVPLCLTKDEKLICSSKLYLNDFTDIEVINNSLDYFFISDYLLEEIETLNFGYKYDNGLYKNILENVSDKKETLTNNKLKVVTIEELFIKYKNNNLLFIFDILDELKRGEIAIEKLISVTNEYNLTERVTIKSKHENVKNALDKYSTNLFSSTDKEKNNFFLTQMLGINYFDKSKFDMVECYNYETINVLNLFEIKINCFKENYVNRFHRRNVAVLGHIDDESMVKDILKTNVDIIIMDDEKILEVVKASLNV